MRGVRRAALPAAAALALVVGLPAVAPAASAGPAPLERAREAAEETAFEGVIEVRWRDGATTHTERLTVQAAGGSLVVRGANQVMARPMFGRLLAHGGGGWEEMWLPSVALTPRPDGVAKYQTTTSGGGPVVAGRPTTTVEVHHRGALLERMHLDTQTSLLLQRDQYDVAGTVVRTLAFQSLRLDPAGPPPGPPRSPSHHAPDVVDPGRVPSSAAAPAALEEGYRRLGVYRSGPVLHVLYSDGVYDLSLFQQPGRLRRSDLPDSGERVPVGGATGRHYTWPGGQVVVWSAGGRVFTAVSDAPPGQVLDAVRSLPDTPRRALSLLGKVRRASQALMEPLS